MSFKEPKKVFHKPKGDDLIQIHLDFAYYLHLNFAFPG